MSLIRYKIDTVHEIITAFTKEAIVFIIRTALWSVVDACLFTDPNGESIQLIE